jgi:membrane-bound lytic murein transglycosylase D
MTDLVAKVHEMELAALRTGTDFRIRTKTMPQSTIWKRADVPAADRPEPADALGSEVRNATHDLPIELNSRVLPRWTTFRTDAVTRRWKLDWRRSDLYRPMMERILQEEGVPLDLIYLSQAESAFLPRAVSRAKPRLWQFISSRGKEYGLRQTWWIDERRIRKSRHGRCARI